MTQKIGGWAMPEADKYFSKFIPADGPLPKINGFQRDHLLAAFQYVNRWGTALDIGAHVGFWCRDMAERFDFVHAFESASDTFACLEQNTSDLDNVILYHKAVGEQAGSAVICFDPKNEPRGNTGSRFVRPVSTPYPGTVEMIAIDDLDMNACDFIKIDVEGYEWKVLKGAINTIKRYKPVVIMEIKRFKRRYDDIRYGESGRYLLENGYLIVATLGRDSIFVPA